MDSFCAKREWNIEVKTFAITLEIFVHFMIRRNNEHKNKKKHKHSSMDSLSVFTVEEGKQKQNTISRQSVCAHQVLSICHFFSF
jgi:hypothetical protein